MLSLRQNKDPSFPGHAPGKDTLRAANAATKVGVTGRKRVKRKRLPVVFPSFFVVPRQNKDSRRVGGHVPPQRHLDRSAATTGGEGARGENGLSGPSDYPCSCPVLLRCPPVKIKIPVATADMRRHSDTLRGAQRRRKRGSRGENNRTSHAK